jgi:hypothetical protein
MPAAGKLTGRNAEKSVVRINIEGRPGLAWLVKAAEARGAPVSKGTPSTLAGTSGAARPASDRNTSAKRRVVAGVD